MENHMDKQMAHEMETCFWCVYIYIYTFGYLLVVPGERRNENRNKKKDVTGGFKTEHGKEKNILLAA